MSFNLVMLTSFRKTVLLWVRHQPLPTLPFIFQFGNTPSFPPSQNYNYISDALIMVLASSVLQIQNRTMKDGPCSNNEWMILEIIIRSSLPTLNFYHSRGNLVIELPLPSFSTLLLLVRPVVQFLVQLCTKNTESTSIHPTTLMPCCPRNSKRLCIWMC